mmetsp:Transcript_136557/g.323443  ORF Transcript_136557/g.323443 Transcript_136557/m.323443 type:complete len:651 (+) Transcript_136557:55-2007(+)
MQEGDEIFEAAMVAVKRHFDAEEFEPALKLITKAYEMKPNDPLVVRSYIYTLVNVSQWENVLKACEKHAALEDFTLEHAYALYRLNRFQQALQVLDSRKAADKDAAASRLRLQAQIQYRLSDYGACADVYEKLHQEDAEDHGLIVNAVASYVSGDRPRQAMNLIARNKEALESSYELCFNAACALIDEGRLKEAEDKLTQAKELCTEELMQAEEIGEEDAALLEDHEELAAIRVQQACVMQRRGLEEEAKEVYDKVLRQKPNQGHEVDVTVLAVACNNVVALRSEGKSLFDSLKRINVASKEGLEHKQTRRQTVEIACNKVLLLLQAQKIDVAKKELDKLCESYPDHPRVALVQAAIAHREKKGKVCEEILQGYIASHADDQVVLPLAQLYTQQQKHDLAVEVLAKLPLSSRTQPTTVEAIVNLHQRQKSPDKAVACLREAIKYWSSQEEESETLAQVVRIAARLAMQLKDRAFAAEVYQSYLENIDGSDYEALCGLVQALAVTDPERATEYAERLQVPAFDHLDPEELEAQPIPKVGAMFSQRRRDREDEADGKPVRVKKKRKRKIRYPKGFDPENPGPPPDPERWLPKRERSEFKKKMRKRDKHLLRGPQGAITTEDFRKQGPSTAQVEVSKDASGPSRRSGRKAKGK